VPDKTVTTQEGEVPLGARTSSAPVQEVAFSSPTMEKEAADKLAAESAEIFRGEDWSDLPNYYCPLCNYATLDGDAAVISHGMDRHPGVDLVAAQEAKTKASVSEQDAATVEAEVAEDRPETAAEEQVVTNG
jgi:hypothetical protein